MADVHPPARQRLPTPAEAETIRDVLCVAKRLGGFERRTLSAWKRGDLKTGPV
jgi:hypothetical protein